MKFNKILKKDSYIYRDALYLVITATDSIGNSVSDTLVVEVDINFLYVM